MSSELLNALSSINTELADRLEKDDAFRGDWAGLDTNRPEGKNTPSHKGYSICLTAVGRFLASE